MAKSAAGPGTTRAQAEKVGSLDGYVFTKGGIPIEVTELQRLHRNACRKASVAGFNFHDWRSAAVSRWLEMGISAQLQKIASGHATTDGVHDTYVSMPNRNLAKIFQSKWKPYDEESFGDLLEAVADQARSRKRDGRVYAHIFIFPLYSDGVENR